MFILIVLDISNEKKIKFGKIFMQLKSCPSLFKSKYIAYGNSLDIKYLNVCNEDTIEKNVI